MAVVAVVGADGVPTFEMGAYPGRHGLLPGGQVDRRLHVLLGVDRDHGILEGADAQHGQQQAPQHRHGQLGRLHRMGPSWVA
jgi:hypothetical protein